jgi:hypothetical protein
MGPRRRSVGGEVGSSGQTRGFNKEALLYRYGVRFVVSTGSIERLVSFFYMSPHTPTPLL